MSDLYYRIVYPRGDRTELAVAQVYDWEEDEWDIASAKKFEHREAAADHMVYLAEKHGLNCPRQPKLLD
jgi:hypothetical protein